MLVTLLVDTFKSETLIMNTVKCHIRIQCSKNSAAERARNKAAGIFFLLVLICWYYWNCIRTLGTCTRLYDFAKGGGGVTSGAAARMKIVT
jgi:hypothetical protein